MELNNGGPSGGHIVDLNRESLLINMLHISQNSYDFSKVGKYLLAMNSDYSLIFNTADNKTTRSYEFSSKFNMKPYFPKEREGFVSTNFFLNKTWEETWDMWNRTFPIIDDETTWRGGNKKRKHVKVNRIR